MRDTSVAFTIDLVRARAETNVGASGTAAQEHGSKGALDQMRSTLYQGRGNTARAVWCWIGLCTALGASPAVAINPDLSLTQLAHSAWRLQDGDLPGTPTAIAQTKDGY